MTIERERETERERDTHTQWFCDHGVFWAVINHIPMDIVGTYDSYVEGAPQQLQRELSIGFGDDDDDDDDDDDGINQPAQLVTRPF